MNKRYHGKRHATGRFTRWSSNINRHFASYLVAFNNSYWAPHIDWGFSRWMNYLRELAFKAAHQIKTQCNKGTSLTRLAFRQEAKLSRFAYIKLIMSKYE